MKRLSTLCLTRWRGADNILGSPQKQKLFTRGNDGQEDISAQQQPPQEDPRVPRADEDRPGPAGSQTQARERSEKIDGIVRAPDVEQRGPAPRETLTWDDRLHHRRQFEAVYTLGSRIAGRSFTLFILPNDCGNCRLGVTVSRKVGNAVVRNQARRRLREIFRRQRAALGIGNDIVIHVRPEAARRPLAALRDEFLSGLARFKAARRETTRDTKDTRERR